MLEKLSEVPNLEYENLNKDTKSIVVQSDSMVRKISFGDMADKITEINKSDLKDSIDDNARRIAEIAGRDSELISVNSNETAFPYGGVIGELIDDISQMKSDVSSLKNPVEYIFNAQHTGINGATECFSIKAYGKTFMIDVGRTHTTLDTKFQCSSRLWKTITDNDINHIDYLTISHWHYDHARGLPSFYRQYKKGIDITVNGKTQKFYEGFAVETDDSAGTFTAFGNTYSICTINNIKYKILPLYGNGSNDSKYLIDSTTKFYFPMPAPVLGSYISSSLDKSGNTKTVKRGEGDNRKGAMTDFYSWLKNLGIININISSESGKVTSINDISLDTSTINKIKYSEFSPNYLFKDDNGENIIYYPDEGDMLSLTKNYDSSSNKVIYDFEYIKKDELSTHECSDEFTFTFLNCSSIPCDRTILFSYDNKYVYIDKTKYNDKFYYKYSIAEYGSDTNYGNSTIIYNDVKYCANFDFSLENYTEKSPFHRDIMMIEEEIDDAHGKASSTYFTRYMVNDYSMCCLVNHLGRTVLYGGDIMRAAQEHLMRCGLVPKGIDLYKYHHHGHNFLYGNWALSAPQWALYTQPKELVLCAGTNRNNSTTLANDTLFYGDIPMYQPVNDDVIYVTSGGSMYRKKVDVNLDFTRKNYYTETKGVIWVDWSVSSSNLGTNDVEYEDVNSDGSYWRPFRNVSSAISFYSMYKDRLSANLPTIIIKCKSDNDSNDYLNHNFSGYSVRTKDGMVSNSDHWICSQAKASSIAASDLNSNLGITIASEHYYRNGISGSLNTSTGKIPDNRRRWIKLYHFGGYVNIMHNCNIRFVGIWFASQYGLNTLKTKIFQLSSDCNLTLQACIIDNLHYNGDITYDESNFKEDFYDKTTNYRYNKETDTLGEKILRGKNTVEYTAILVNGNNSNVRVDVCEFWNFHNVVYITYATNSKAIFNSVGGDCIRCLCRGGHVEHINPHITISNLGLDNGGIVNESYLTGKKKTGNYMHIYSDVQTISYSNNSDYFTKKIFAQGFSAKSAYSSSRDIHFEFNDNSSISSSESGDNYLKMENFDEADEGNNAGTEGNIEVETDDNDNDNDIEEVDALPNFLELSNSELKNKIYNIPSDDYPNGICYKVNMEWEEIDYTPKSGENITAISSLQEGLYDSDFISGTSISMNGYIGYINKIYKYTQTINGESITKYYKLKIEWKEYEEEDSFYKIMFFEYLLKMYSLGIAWNYGNDSGMDINLPHNASSGNDYFLYNYFKNNSKEPFRLKAMINQGGLTDAYGGDLTYGSTNVEMLSGGVRLKYVQKLRKYPLEETEGANYLDLDNIKTPGTYIKYTYDSDKFYCKSTSSSNFPENLSRFTLIVKYLGVADNNYPVEQVIKCSKGIYKRKFKSNGTKYAWTNWVSESGVSASLNSGSSTTYTISFD